MLVRPFGLLGTRYRLNPTGKKYYKAAWTVAVLFIACVMITGIVLIRNPEFGFGTTPLLAMIFWLLILAFTIIRLVARTLENGEKMGKSQEMR